MFKTLLVKNGIERCFMRPNAFKNIKAIVALNKSWQYALLIVVRYHLHLLFPFLPFISPRISTLKHHGVYNRGVKKPLFFDSRGSDPGHSKNELIVSIMLELGLIE